MPVPSAMVGHTLSPITHDVDERWTMSYSAGLGDTDACYFDTTNPDGVVAHPLFAVCPEWPAIVAGRDVADQWGITPDETRRSVHATHDLVIHRLVRPGDRLTTEVTYTGLEAKSPGAFSTMRLSTVDADGQPVSTTHQGGIYLGVATDGPDVPPADLPTALPLGDLPASPCMDVKVPIAHGAAHTYTECARIWNPIHTDAAVAEKAGLPGIILHGTATLAHGVSVVVRECAGGQPQRVRRICGRFKAMVLMPSTITVRIHDCQPVDGDAGTGEPGSYQAVRFEVLTEEGAPAVDAGVVVLAD